MKKYLYNKDFLPKSFIRAKNNQLDNTEKRDAILMTVIACILLPISVGNIKSNMKEEKTVINYNRLNENEDNKKLYSWFNIIDMCFEGNLTRNEGNVYVYDKQNLEGILQDENIVINTMEDLGENKYRLQVVQNEIYK
ncbi:hypothetical protein NNC19_16665 [Clostridium sp. SHJSY1]|uniref:hypothetical protein n=1 Tax=Clostridium sp. SHJSY1 TaxID=2942483 RepID=UPI00287444B8|nr:hypothetical protein [Clostridium sp. SHJSY1]MDS0527325.1 hypothetical protein [Clostridium sp. SHJSY1]